MAAATEVTHTLPQPQSASTLRTIVELVRRITRADVTSIASFSLAEKTMTWMAASGFRTHMIDDDHPLVRPMNDRIHHRALTAEEVFVLEGIGARDELPAANFPVHMAEGVVDLAVALLRARGQTLGALMAGYRSSHHFTDDEKSSLQD